jgi:hypothetical protein
MAEAEVYEEGSHSISGNAGACFSRSFHLPEDAVVIKV